MKTTLHLLIDKGAGVLGLNPTGEISPDEKLSVMRPMIKDARKLAKNAVCFYMGNYEGVMSLPFSDSHNNLPYQTTWFEMELNGPEFQGLGARIGVLAHQPDTAGEITAYVFLFLARFKTWSFRGFYIAAPGENSLLCWPKGDLDEEDFHSNEEVFLSAIYVSRFLGALNCMNVQQTETKPPRWLQMQRRRERKTPLFSYWTLSLVVGGSASTSGALGGSHASPRVHLRRGHIRQYAPGKFTWVQPCTVGDKALGMVHKDYAVKSAEKWGQQ